MALTYVVYTEVVATLPPFLLFLLASYLSKYEKSISNSVSLTFSGVAFTLKKLLIVVGSQGELLQSTFFSFCAIIHGHLLTDLRYLCIYKTKRLQ